MVQEREARLLFPDLLADYKRSSAGVYKESDWTRWIDKKVFKENMDILSGIRLSNYQKWLEIYFRLFRWDAPTRITGNRGVFEKSMYPDPFFIPLSNEIMVDNKPLWAFNFSDKGFPYSRGRKSIFETRANDLESGTSSYIEREKIRNFFGLPAIIERVYWDRKKTLLKEVTTISGLDHESYLFRVDDLERRYNYQYRLDTYHVNVLPSEFDLTRMLRAKVQFAKFIFGGDIGDWGVIGARDVSLS